MKSARFCVRICAVLICSNVKSVLQSVNMSVETCSLSDTAKQHVFFRCHSEPSAELNATQIRNNQSLFVCRI